mmetsp:Transcript_13545/g.17839  ORF Transcript_13545/g.17839 Transcript_13545/m.17839 type:complete len:227 (+) Transcript_13545:98-778(+)
MFLSNFWHQRRTLVNKKTWKYFSITKKFASIKYWEEFYAREDDARSKSFEWFLQYNTIEPIIISKLPQKCSVLHIGCGTSNVGVNLAKQGFKVKEVDASKNAIKRCKELHSENLGQAEFFVAKAQELPFESCSIDAAIDKGTLDALLCGYEEDAHMMLADVHRILKKNGVYIQITTEAPELRKELFENAATSFHKPYQWGSISFTEVSSELNDDDYSYFIYFLEKK